MSIVRLSKVAATFACGLLALCLALQLWQAYVLAPWTRDGRVSAQVIRIAPEVSGSVEAVFVADNQRVARGDPLYRIDPRSYRLAVRQREAELEQARETLRQRDEQWRRRMQLAGAVSREEVANAGRALRIARARAEAAGAALDQARLDLRRSELRSPVDGYVTQLRVQPGDYAAAGRTNIFIVDRRSFWVTGYFEETKLRNVQVGAPATIKLMGSIRCSTAMSRASVAVSPTSTKAVPTAACRRSARTSAGYAWRSACRCASNSTGYRRAWCLPLA